MLLGLPGVMVATTLVYARCSKRLVDFRFRVRVEPVLVTIKGGRVKKRVSSKRRKFRRSGEEDGGVWRRRRRRWGICPSARDENREDA